MSLLYIALLDQILLLYSKAKVPRLRFENYFFRKSYFGQFSFLRLKVVIGCLSVKTASAFFENYHVKP